MPPVAMVTKSLWEGNSISSGVLVRVILWWIGEYSEGVPHMLSYTDSVTKYFLVHELLANSTLYTRVRAGKAEVVNMAHDGEIYKGGSVL